MMDELVRQIDKIGKVEQLELFSAETFDDVPLGTLADWINRGHGEIKTAVRRLAVHVAQVGAWLVAAQEQVGYGNWIKWLSDNCPSITRMTANRYIRTYQKAIECPDVTLMLQEWTPTQAYKDLEIVKDAAAHVSRNTGENEWYTPPEYIEAARAVLGEIELDPASSNAANKTVKATRYYTAENDGLTKEWRGKVWMNPPYSQPLIGQFTEKLRQHVLSGDVPEAVVLVNNATETEWFQALFDVFSAACFPNGRIRFIDKDGNPSGAPLQGQAVIYIGKEVKFFIKAFKEFGRCLLSAE